ncbi:MAG: PLP-dependent transferase, partial [Clostridia bacterium]|nr:PLP-dependent transferase [Clostridia bacterium]
MKFDTIALHAGYRKDAANSAITVPIYQSNAYHYDTAQQAADRFALKD